MSRPKIRCAIYTRKSSDEGLEQDFNSLDAQYEACADYVASQRHEGWALCRERYDDGGISGGTLERPGLQALLHAIDAGRIDRIVVYKIDRLTRSLSDFAKIVDRLDAANASFVSVTQSFNTASSMGRLTLNMLLSFAQFEREVTAERIRDKIAASKARGIWMGGTVPLGYDPHPDKATRALVINQAEAENVRTIFRLAASHSNLRGVTDEITRRGIRSKRRDYASGKRLGGAIMSKGQIHYILTNPIYLGRIRHKDKTYPGQHDALIDQGLWDRVQRKLSDGSARTRGRPTHGSAALLKGRIYDETGDRLTPTHTVKAGRKFRYYISNRLLAGKDPSGWRLPAQSLEQTVLAALRAGLNDPLQITRWSPSASAQTMTKVLDATQQAACETELDLMLTRVDLHPGELRMTLNKDVVARVTGLAADEIAPESLHMTAPITLRRRGVEQKLILGSRAPDPNPELVRCLAEAHLWMELVKDGKTLPEVAASTGRDQIYIRRRIRIATLSPRIQRAITTGEHPDLWSIQFFIERPIPLEWRAQETALL